MAALGVMLVYSILVNVKVYAFPIQLLGYKYSIIISIICDS